MGKKITETQRLIDFAMSATEEQLFHAVELFKAIGEKRFPTVAPRAPRKPRKDKGTPRKQQPDPPEEVIQ